MAASIPELLRELREMVLLHPAVQCVQIRGQATSKTKGYLRLRLVLRSQDLVEVFVYLVEEDEGIFLKNYSVHWQQADGALIQRWDNAPHHPELANFPCHTHRSPDVVEPTPTLQWDDIHRLLKERILDD